MLTLLAAALSFAVTVGKGPAAQPADATPRSRASVLARGVNISHWYWIPRDPSIEGMTAFITGADVDQLKGLGITHARIPVEPDYLWDAEKDALKADNLALYKSGIELFTSRGVAVVVDPHPSRTPWAEPKEGGFADEFDGFWAELAKSLRGTDPKLVFLEVMNEPHDMPDKETWPRLQERFAKTIRAGAPGHTIIATGDEWGSVDGLVRLKPLPDANVIYTFHIYDPHTFTHQGASWGAPNWKNLREVPYPSSPELVKDSLEATTNEQGKREVRWYGEQRWNAGKIGARIGMASAWAKQHNTVVWCGEFGAFREKTPAESRAAWLRDLTGAMNKAGIGWCMWDYAGSFALVSGAPGARVLHDDTADGIGLRKVR